MDARSYLNGLVGKEIRTITGKPNRILRVTGGEVVVGTATSPQGSPVPIAHVQAAFDQLERDGTLEISVESLGHRRSSFVGAVLRSRDDVDVVRGAVPQRVRLVRPRG